MRDKINGLANAIIEAAEELRPSPEGREHIPAVKKQFSEIFGEYIRLVSDQKNQEYVDQIQLRKVREKYHGAIKVLDTALGPMESLQ